MKKLILFWAILVLFPILCYADYVVNCEKYSAKVDICPQETPYLSEEISLNYFYPAKIKHLTPLVPLVEREEVSEYPKKFTCHDEKDSLCKRVRNVENYRKKMLEEEKLLKMENQKIDEKHRVIAIKDAGIYQQEQIYESYRKKIKIEKQCKEFVVFGEYSDSIWDRRAIPAGETELENWLNEAEYIVQENAKILEKNQKTREKNLEIEKENEKIERENAEIEKQFQAYYTPEKMVQLFNDYERAISEKCVGCDYPKPLDLDEDDCNECPNREYVDGKCVLKKEILNQVQNDNKKKE